MLLTIVGKTDSGKSTLAKALAEAVYIETESKVQFKVLDEDYVGNRVDIINWCLATDTFLIVERSIHGSGIKPTTVLSEIKDQKYIHLMATDDQVLFTRESNNVLIVSRATHIDSIVDVVLEWLRSSN